MTSRESERIWAKAVDDRRLAALSQDVLIIRTRDDLIFAWASDGDQQRGSRRESDVREFLLDCQDKSIEHQSNNDIVPMVREPLSLGGRIMK